MRTQFLYQLDWKAARLPVRNTAHSLTSTSPHLQRTAAPSPSLSSALLSSSKKKVALVSGKGRAGILTAIATMLVSRALLFNVECAFASCWAVDTASVGG